MLSIPHMDRQTLLCSVPTTDAYACTMTVQNATLPLHAANTDGVNLCANDLIMLWS